MKNPAPYIRTALYTLLNGAVSYNAALVPVFENEGDEGAPLQILVREYADADRSSKSNFRGNASQVIEIVSEQPTSARRVVDEVGELVMNLIKPTTKTDEVLSGTDFQVMVKGKPTINHLTENSGSGTRIVRLIMRWALLIVER